MLRVGVSTKSPGTLPLCWGLNFSESSDNLFPLDIPLEREIKYMIDLVCDSVPLVTRYCIIALVEIVEVGKQ